MENISVDHIPINDIFCNEKLASVKVSSPWFVDYSNFIVAKFMPPSVYLLKFGCSHELLG
jgi:hypothetical protein